MSKLPIAEEYLLLDLIIKRLEIGTEPEAFDPTIKELTALLQSVPVPLAGDEQIAMWKRMQPLSLPFLLPFWR